MAKLILMTGFLGAGKTTMMQSLLDNYSDKKVGVIVNDFGKVNVDYMTLKREGIFMEELSNGSIFCACIKDHFLTSLIHLSGMDLEYVFVEASGLADPSTMEQILKTISSKTISAYEYIGSICIVDAENFLGLYELLPAFERQILYSGAVIINKADLVTFQQIEEIKDIIQRCNPKASQYITSYCKVDLNQLMKEVSTPSIEGVETSNTPENRPKSVILEIVEELPYDSLLVFLRNIAKSAYRIKGFAPTDQGYLAVNAVGSSIHLDPIPELPDQRIVVISKIGIKMISLITEELNRNMPGKMKITI